MKKLSQSASFHAGEEIAPAKYAIKHLKQTEKAEIREGGIKNAGVLRVSK